MRLPRNLYSTEFLSTRRPDQLNYLEIQDAIELPEFEEYVYQSIHSESMLTLVLVSSHASEHCTMDHCHALDHLARLCHPLDPHVTHIISMCAFYYVDSFVFT